MFSRLVPKQYRYRFQLNRSPQLDFRSDSSPRLEDHVPLAHLVATCSSNVLSIPGSPPMSTTSRRRSAHQEHINSSGLTVSPRLRVISRSRLLPLAQFEPVRLSFFWWEPRLSRAISFATLGALAQPFATLVTAVLTSEDGIGRLFHVYSSVSGKKGKRGKG